VLLIGLAAGSCHKPVAGTLGQPVQVPIHRALTFDGRDLELYFLRVVSDSRCPKNVNCITAGEAVVILEGRVGKGAPETLEVRLSGGEGASDTGTWTQYDGYRIRLLELEPYPVAGSARDTTAYAGTFLVQNL